MTDTPSTILLTREQSTGSNTNLWGGYLITTQRQTEQASKGYQTLAVTGNATISWTSYSTGNTGQCAHLKLTGTLSSAATLTFPSYQNVMMVHNTAGATVTIMCSAGTGVAIPNNRRALIYCDATDYYTDTPTWTGDTTTLTNNGDLVSNAQLAAAIAAIVGGSDGLVLTSTTATTRQYLNVGLQSVTNGGISFIKLNGGTATEVMAAALDINNMTASTGSAAGDRFPFYDTIAGANRYETRSNVSGKYGLVLQSMITSTTVAPGNLYPVDCTASISTVCFPAAATVGDQFGFIIGGPYQMGCNPNSLNFNGSTTTQYVDGDQTLLITYWGASRGYI